MFRALLALLVFVSLAGSSAFAAQSRTAMPSSPTAEALTTADYGTLYMLEKREEQSAPWQLGLSYSHELSNAYLNVSGVNASAERELSSYFGIGAQFSYFFSSQTDVTQQVQSALKTDSIQQKVHAPKLSYFGVLSAKPLAGRLNLFSYTTLPFELVLSSGPGVSVYKDGQSYLSMFWSVSPQFMVSQTFGLNFSIGQEIESPFTNNVLARFEAKVGSVLRF